MSFSFIGSDRLYTYQHPVTFTANFKTDASDIIFDHSLSGETAVSLPDDGESSDTESDEKTTEESTEPADISFVYESYWYTEPLTEGNLRIISAYRFNNDGTYSVTDYSKDGSADWVVSSKDGSYTLDNGCIVLEDDGTGIRPRFRPGADGALTEEKNGETVQTLTARRYNSIANSEDFFGI